MEVFKHMKKEHAELFHQGRLRLSSLSYFRGIEGAPAGVKDPFEGRSIGIIPKYDLVPGSDEKNRAVLEQHGFSAGPQASIYIMNSRTTFSVRDCYILSLSLDGTKGLMGPEYDAVVRVSDDEWLAHAIMNGSPGFERCIADKVRYSPVEYDVLSGVRLDPSPFVKDPSFEYQKEFRIVFPDPEVSSPFLDIDCGEIREGYRRGLAARSSADVPSGD